MAQVNVVWCWVLAWPAFLIPEPRYMYMEKFFEACGVGQCGFANLRG